MVEILELPNHQWLRSPKMPDHAICLDQQATFFGWVMKSINGHWVSVRKLTLHDCDFIIQQDESEPHRKVLGVLVDKLIDSV